MSTLVVTAVRRWQGGARGQIAFVEGIIDGTCYVLAKTRLGNGRDEVTLTKRVKGIGYDREYKVREGGRFAARQAALVAALEGAP